MIILLALITMIAWVMFIITVAAGIGPVQEEPLYIWEYPLK